MEENKKTIYLVQSLELDGDGSCDYIIGYCNTKEEAEKEVERLNAKQKESIDKWNSLCVNCNTNCESFDTAGCKEAIDALSEARAMKCPYAKDCELREIKYGDDDDSGGFEVCCDHRVSICGEYTFVVTECEKIKGDN